MDQLCIETYREEDVLVLDGCRLEVPTHKRDAILRLLHAGHGGIAKTYRIAVQLYYWPNMKADIEQSVANCSPCQEQRQSNPKPTMNESNGLAEAAVKNLKSIVVRCTEKGENFSTPSLPGKIRAAKTAALRRSSPSADDSVSGCPCSPATWRRTTCNKPMLRAKKRRASTIK